MKYVSVYGSKRPAIVDDDDYEFVSQFDWYLQKGCAWTLIARAGREGILNSPMDSNEGGGLIEFRYQC